MAEEDEIDVLGDFSFNSCFAQNSQGILTQGIHIEVLYMPSKGYLKDLMNVMKEVALDLNGCTPYPSCSDREDTVHPQWLLDATANNWYDTQNKGRNRMKEGPSRRLSGNNATNKNSTLHTTAWSQVERDILKKEMAKYGRNVRKISQTLKTKTEPEIQALIEAEHGIQLDTSVQGLEKYEAIEETPPVIQEEIVTDDPVSDILSRVTTGTPTVPLIKQPFKKKNNSTINSNVKLKKNISKVGFVSANVVVNPSEIFYDDDLTIGSTELIKAEVDSTRNMAIHQNERIKALKKIGNHRRKVSRNYEKSKRNRSMDSKKSPQGRQRKDSSLSLPDDGIKSPKMQIVLGSGQALPVSEGEQVIKIEKTKDSECESDIEVDIDSDNEVSPKKKEHQQQVADEDPIAVPLRKFEPMRKRTRKIPLDGGGGYTIMHTEAGDLYEIAQEPRKERAPKKPPIHLLQCRLYNDEKPPPCEVHLHVSALISMDVHAHSSRAEVMGLVGGEWCEPRLYMRLYRTARAAAAATHCDMDPVSQASAAEWLRSRGLDHWPARTVPSVSRLRCFRVEDTEEATGTPIGYQLKVKLVPDLTTDSLPQFLRELRGVLADRDRSDFNVNVAADVCPQAGLTYLEKCILSIRHHMHSAGYEHDAPLVELLVRGVRDVVR
ncbi:jg4056 [Pararge aegeria aegeria]|uniref:Jg4056 protein n=1 Tax=Pararge aegeria aegeria TaxID=348720 RepID=A0A8S4R5D9_9NEOP|nr:jg4056 [Pararge aegeria aegeria]